MASAPPLNTPVTAGLTYSVEVAKEERENKHWWRRSTFVSLGLNALLILFLGLLSLQRKEIPYMYDRERGTGVVRPLGPVPPFADPLEDTIRFYISELVLTLRWIGTDVEETQRRWKQTQWRMTKGGRALFLQYEQQWQPLLQHEPNKVEVATPLRRTAHTYEVRWTETRFTGGDKREPQKPSNYVGTVTFQSRPPLGTEERTHNPAGIFFDTWQWSKE